MNSFVTLPKLTRGDQAAVISPSAGLPGLFPWVQELGLQRLRDISLDHVRLLDGNTLYVQDKLIPVSDTYRETLYRVVRG